MRHHSPAEIEYPEAYAAAIKASIHGRANAKREREWRAANPDLAEWVFFYDANIPSMITNDGGRTYVANTAARHPLGPVPGFIQKAVEEWGAPSEGATRKLREIFAERQARNAKREEERAAERASAQVWTAGRQVVEGEIISVKVTEGFAPYHGAALPTVFKALVKREDGSRIFLTVPRAIEDAFYAAQAATAGPVPAAQEPFSRWLKGRRIRLTVTVEPKAEEPTFAFGSRPAKAEILAPEVA